MLNHPNFLKLLFLLALLFVANSRKLLMIHQIFRHGARYPIAPLPNDYSDYAKSENSVGELTAQGRHMQYILGKSIYQKYWNKLFAGTAYSQKYHPSQILIVSTDINRTLESAQSQVVGLLEQLPMLELPSSQASFSVPPIPGASQIMRQRKKQGSFKVFGEKNLFFHSVPIHSPADFLIYFEPQNCPKQKLWAMENQKCPELVKIKSSEQINSLLSALKQATGVQVPYQEIDNYYDNFMCAKYLSKKYLSLFDDDKFTKTAEMVAAVQLIIKNSYTERQRKASNTQLLKNILHNMNEATSRKGPRIVLYSAHDSTLLSFGSALNFTNINCVIDHFYNGKENSDTCIYGFPVFGSNYVIELWQEDDFTHSVKFLYNGVERKIPICGYKPSCDFADFQRWAQTFALADVRAACGALQPTAARFRRHNLGHQ